MFENKGRLILASASPRRRDLLAGCGLVFEVLAADCLENRLDQESPPAMVQRLALLKARKAASQMPQAWVLGADTDVEIDGEMLGKPENAEDTRRLLSRIEGRVHSVWGGFAIVNLSRQIEHVEVHQSLVEIIPMDPALIEAYAATQEPPDKAGAYAAQGIGAALVSSIKGSYTNVVGLNLAAVLKALRTLGAINLTGQGIHV